MSFPDFARAVGLNAPHYLDDGRVHRCATAAHPRKRNGAYRWEGDWGWCQDWANHVEPVIWKDHTKPAQVRQRPVVDADLHRHAAAAAEASRIVGKCEQGPHPYLSSKGFPKAEGLLDFDGRLVVPMRSCVTYTRIQSLQWISKDGEKKFMTGGKARGGIFALGSGEEQWLCEGYATGLSVQAALAKLYRQSRVVVCFSAGNLAHVAGCLRGRRFVVADNDQSGTGERVARAAGLPWVMPPTVGDDANDFHQRDGVFALADLLRGAL